MMNNFCSDKFEKNFEININISKNYKFMFIFLNNK